MKRFVDCAFELTVLLPLFVLAAVLYWAADGFVALIDAMTDD